MLWSLLTSWLPWWLRGYRICLQCRRSEFNPWAGMIPWRREWLSTPGEIHGQRSLVGYRQWSHKELDMTEWLTLSLSLFTFLHSLLWRNSVCVLSRVWLFVTPWIVTHQAPLSTALPRQEYWNYHFLLQGIFLIQGSNTHLSISYIGRWIFTTKLPGKPLWRNSVSNLKTSSGFLRLSWWSQHS